MSRLSGWPVAAAILLVGHAASAAQAGEPPGSRVLRSPSVATGRALFNAVEVDDEGAPPARARRGWRPAAVAEGEVFLRRSDLLDATWVRDQFRLNRMIGEPVDLDRLVALIQRINRAFVDNGYINSGLLIVGDPPGDGQPLRVRIVAGRLAPIGDAGAAIVWSRGHSRGLTERYIRARVPAATTVPLDAVAVERDFRVLAESAAIRTVNADLKPGARAGEASLVLTVDPAPRFDLYLVAANDRSPSIGGERFAVGGSVRNALIAGDLLSAEAGLTGGRGDGVVSYDMPVFDTRTDLLVRGGFNDAAVTDPELRSLGIRATDRHFEVGLARRIVQRPLLPRSGAEESAGGWRAARTISLSARFAHRDSRTYLFGLPFSFSPGSVDGRSRYSAARLAADWVERGTTSVVGLSLVATQGLDGTGSDVAALAFPSRHARTLRLQGSLARRLSRTGAELRMRLSGQLADGILYSGEKLAVGGADTVRGYRETLLLADTGAIGSVEIVQPFDLAGRGRARAVGAFAISGFVDGAFTRNRAGTSTPAQTIGSIGTTLAWFPLSGVRVNLTYARPLRHVPIAGRRDIQDRGLAFRIVFRPLEF